MRSAVYSLTTKREKARIPTRINFCLLPSAFCPFFSHLRRYCYPPKQSFMNPGDLFRANLSLIDRTIDRICRRSRLFGPDAEDFASAGRLGLIADDYALLG